MSRVGPMDVGAGDDRGSVRLQACRTPLLHLLRLPLLAPDPDRLASLTGSATGSRGLVVVDGDGTIARADQGHDDTADGVAVDDDDGRPERLHPRGAPAGSDRDREGMDELVTRSTYRGQRCFSISDDGVRCVRELGHLGARDAHGREAPPIHRSRLCGRPVQWQDATETPAASMTGAVHGGSAGSPGTPSVLAPGGVTASVDEDPGD